MKCRNAFFFSKMDTSKLGFTYHMIECQSDHMNHPVVKHYVYLRLRLRNRVCEKS